MFCFIFNFSAFADLLFLNCPDLVMSSLVGNNSWSSAVYVNPHNFLMCFLVSGRCWIFSCLNVMRLPFMKKLNIEEFEFSQSYLFFWDKVWDGSGKILFVLISALVETASSFVAFPFIPCPFIMGETPFILTSRVSKVESFKGKNCFWLVGGYFLQWDKFTDSSYLLVYLKF